MIKENSPSIRDIIFENKDFLQVLPLKIMYPLNAIITTLKKWGESQEANLRQLKSQINNLIPGRKIIIIIDDIDRLMPDEIRQILKLIKLGADFERITYLTAFDPIVIKKALSQEEISGNEYLQKIIQHHITVPVIEQDDLDNFYLSQIENIFQKLGLSSGKIEEFGKEFTPIYKNYVSLLFPTLRQVKRYINSLLFDLPQVKNEVYLLDFLLLQTIKISKLEVYDDISKNWWIYVDERFENDYSNNPLFIYRFTDKEEARKQIIKSHVENLINKSDEGGKNKEIFIELLSNLFSNVNEAFDKHYQHFAKSGSNGRPEKRIYSTCFHRYFTLKPTLSREIPDTLVEDIIEMWNKSVPHESEKNITETFRKFKAKNEINQFLFKLSIFFNISAKMSIDLVKSIYNNIDIFSDKSFWDTEEYENVRSLFLDLVDRKVEKSQMQPLLIEAVTSVSSLEFATYIVYYCERNKFFNISENTDVVALRKLVVKRLSNCFIIDNKDIFMEFIFKKFKEERNGMQVLFSWASWDREKVNDYVFSLFNKHPEYIGIIIRHCVTFIDKCKPGAIYYDTLLELYDVNRLYGLISEKDKKVYSTDDEKLAIDLFCMTYQQKQKELNK